jgi:hypothetical protein
MTLRQLECAIATATIDHDYFGTLSSFTQALKKPLDGRGFV